MQIDNEKLRTYAVSEIESILMDMKVNIWLLCFYLIKAVIPNRTHKRAARRCQEGCQIVN
jgi:hypothetical protein